MKDLLNENYKSVKKEIKQDIRKMERSPMVVIGRINIVEMARLSKAMYKNNVILITLTEKNQS
jgi:hypothetical protein